MNKNRFQSDMEAAWELRPDTDAAPSTKSHYNRFSAKKQGIAKPQQGGQQPPTDDMPPAKTGGDTL